MNMADAVFAADKHEYLSEVVGNFAFKIPFIDFDSKEPRDAVVAINKWVDNVTNHLIPDVMAYCMSQSLIFHLLRLMISIVCFSFHGRPP